MNLNPIFLQAQAAPSSGGLFDSILFPMGLMLLIFFFLVIRPQQKRQKQHQEMLKSSEKGDVVVTSGGIHGKVTGVTDDVLTLEIATLKGGDRVRIKVNRSSLESVTKADAGEQKS